MSDHVSVEPFHPGEYLREELEARFWTGNVLAEKMGVPPEDVAMILARMGPMTQRFADRLCLIFHAYKGFGSGLARLRSFHSHSPCEMMKPRKHGLY